MEKEFYNIGPWGDSRDDDNNDSKSMSLTAEQNKYFYSFYKLLFLEDWPRGFGCEKV